MTGHKGGGMAAALRGFAAIQFVDLAPVPIDRVDRDPALRIDALDRSLCIAFGHPGLLPRQSVSDGDARRGDGELRDRRM